MTPPVSPNCSTHSPFLNWRTQIPAALLETTSKVCRLAERILPRLLMWGVIGLSALLYSQAFVYGMTWGLFLACCDVAIGQKWADRLPKIIKLKPSKSPSPKQYAGLAGTLFLGTVLFGGGTTFMVGWVCGEGLIDRVGRRF